MNILLIDIDSARPDHFGCYGYARNTTPNIDRFAAEGVRFQRHYCSDAPCVPSRTALFSGKLGITTGVVNHGGVHADLPLEGPGRRFRSSRMIESLAERLRVAGLYTASISPFPHRHSAYHVWEGFHETIDTGKNGQDKGHVVYPFVDDWLQRNRDRENWFLHLNLWDPHTPYQTPLEYGEPFRDDPPPEWLTQEMIDRQREGYGVYDAVTTSPSWVPPETGWLRGTDTIRNRDDFKKWVDGYDTGLNYADHYFGKIVERLKELGLYENTAIILTGDHGENQGELDVYGDHQTADEITCRIPLIVRWPGLTDDKPGRTFDAFHYNIDLSATLVDLAGGEIPESWDGVSFATSLRDGDDRGRTHLVVSQGAWSCQRSVRWDDYILIRTYHTGFKNFPSLMLFNVVEDPHETHNLVDERPDLVGEGLRLLDRWVARHLRKNGRPDPLFQVMAEGGPYHAKDPSYVIERTRATGREHFAEWLEKYDGLPTDEVPDPDRLEP